MIDRFGKEVDFSELFMEETLSAKDKKEIPDSMYGLVYTDEKGNKVRKFPLNDESHVRQAAIFFDRAKGLSDDQKRELARNIVRRAKELDMDYSGWESLKPYLDKPVKESDDKRVNDKGETVPEKCDKCGSPVKVFLRGEPVYLCCNKDCRKYFGTVPCDIQEQYMTYEWLMKQNYPDPDSTSGTSDFDEHDDDPDDCFTESFEEMFGPVIQEAFDAVTGEEISIDKAYSLEEMKERTYTEEELKKSKREIKDYLKFANDIAKRIKAQVEKDSKEPTGNQNCLLCTWCAEIGFRGVNKNPRPVYSPCDPIFKVHGENIVRDPMKIIPRGYDNLLEHLSDVSQPFARFYVHVNWKGSRGGHEFLLLKVIDAEYYIVDAQDGKVDKLDDTHKYFTDINWENSYLCRLDNKNFNRKLFDTMNDPKMTLPWDPKRDIPYMLREGMITKEEAEKELKRSETNEFYKVLKEKLGQTPVQESADSLALFKQLPNDLQEFLKNGDYSMIRREDDSFYVVAGYWVEDFYKPSELELCGEAYSLESDDPYYNTIIFSYENSNSFGFNPKDKSYYYFYHDEYEVKNGKEYIEPYKLEQKTWNEIIKAIPKERVYYRFEYEGEGIYEAYKRHASWLQWHEFKQTYAASWLNVVPNYRNGEKSYFTEEGYKMFMEHTYPEMIKVLDKSKIVEIRVNLKPEDIRYEDKYQATTKAGVPEPKPVQESAIGEILNGVNPFSNKRVFHISLDGHLDGQVFKPRVPEYLDKYDPSQDKFEDVENPRVCFSPSIEGCLNAIMVTIGRWKTAEKLREWYVYVPEKPLKEYKHRTNKQLIKEKKVYDANVTDEIWIEEPVRLKQYGIIRIDQVSSKSVKDTVSTTKGSTGHRYKYSFKWHWLVKPKVIADLPYDYSPMEVCKDMIADMEKFKYGLAENGTVHSASAHDYDTKYKLQSPEEFEQNGGGICYDYVEFMEGYLNAYGYECKKYFISTNTADNDTHTFLLVRDGKGWKDGFIYPESSFKLMEGVYEVKNYEEAALKIMDKIFDVNHNGDKYDEIKYYVWEYSGHPPYGSDMETCMKYFSKGDPIHEGTAMKIKRKD